MVISREAFAAIPRPVLAVRAGPDAMLLHLVQNELLPHNYSF